MKLTKNTTSQAIDYQCDLCKSKKCHKDMHDDNVCYDCFDKMENIKEDIIQKWEGEKYGVWKIISEMLDNPDEVGIYPTTKCYKEIDDLIDQLLKKAQKEWKKEAEKCYEDGLGDGAIVIKDKLAEKISKKAFLIKHNDVIDLDLDALVKLSDIINLIQQER